MFPRSCHIVFFLGFPGKLLSDPLKIERGGLKNSYKKLRRIFSAKFHWAARSNSVGCFLINKLHGGSYKKKDRRVPKKMNVATFLKWHAKLISGTFFGRISREIDWVVWEILAGISIWVRRMNMRRHCGRSSKRNCLKNSWRNCCKIIERFLVNLPENILKLCWMHAEWFPEEIFSNKWTNNPRRNN